MSNDSTKPETKVTKGTGISDSIYGNADAIKKQHQEEYLKKLLPDGVNVSRGTRNGSDTYSIGKDYNGDLSGLLNKLPKTIDAKIVNIKDKGQRIIISPQKLDSFMQSNPNPQRITTHTQEEIYEYANKPAGPGQQYSSLDELKNQSPNNSHYMTIKQIEAQNRKASENTYAIPKSRQPTSTQDPPIYSIPQKTNNSETKDEHFNMLY